MGELHLRELLTADRFVTVGLEELGIYVVIASGSSPLVRPLVPRKVTLQARDHVTGETVDVEFSVQQRGVHFAGSTLVTRA